MKIDRWQKLALAAMKQCGRSFLPMVRELTSLDDLLHHTKPFHHKIIAHEKVAHQISSQHIHIESGQSVLILIGPEGGFSDEEVERCIAAGFAQKYLGERRLRTETAAIVMAGLVLQHERG